MKSRIYPAQRALSFWPYYTPFEVKYIKRKAEPMG